MYSTLHQPKLGAFPCAQSFLLVTRRDWDIGIVFQCYEPNPFFLTHQVTSRNLFNSEVCKVESLSRTSVQFTAVFFLNMHFVGQAI